MKINKSISIILLTLCCVSVSAQVDSIAVANRLKNTEVKVVLPKEYIASGEKINAEILLVEHDTATRAKVFIKGVKTIEMKENKAYYRTIAFGEGEKVIQGYVQYYIGDKYRTFPFEKKYTVYKGAINVSPDRMNVFYIGIENPISIVVPGQKPDRLSVSISNGEIIKTKDKGYIVKVYKRGMTKITVSVKMDNGNNKVVGSSSFRILYPPAVKTQLATLVNGATEDAAVIKEQLKKYPKLLAHMDESFPFNNLRFAVGSYSFTLVKNKGTNSASIAVAGEFLTPEIQDIINSIESGDKIIIDNIKMAKPDEAWRTMPFVITVK